MTPVSVSPLYRLSIAMSAAAAAVCLDVPPVLRLAPRPTRRTVEQIHRDLFRSRYTGAALRRIAADPDRRECRRRRARAAALAIA